MSEKKGDCFYVALQFMHDVETENDPIPHIFSESGIDISEVPLKEEIRLIHGWVKGPTGRIKHAWIELNGYVLDFSNNLNALLLAEHYYQDVEAESVLSLPQHTVFAILAYDSSVVWWGDLNDLEMATIQNRYDSSIFPKQERNFLEEYEEDEG